MRYHGIRPWLNYREHASAEMAARFSDESGNQYDYAFNCHETWRNALRKTSAINAYAIWNYAFRAGFQYSRAACQKPVPMTYTLLLFGLFVAIYEQLDFSEALFYGRIAIGLSRASPSEIKIRKPRANTILNILKRHDADEKIALPTCQPQRLHHKLRARDVILAEWARRHDLRKLSPENLCYDVISSFSLWAEVSKKCWSKSH